MNIIDEFVVQNKNLISVIVPVYNAEFFINKCVESILNQTYKNIEIIIINDGSTDNTGFILADFNLKYRNIKVFNQINQGQGVARNRGLEEAVGEFIFFIDSDDVIYPDCFEKCILFMQNANYDFACFGVNFRKINGEIAKVTRYYHGAILEKDILIDYLSRAKILNVVWNKIYRKEFLDVFRVSFDQERVNEDALFTLKLVCNAKAIGFIPLVLYEHRSDNAYSYSNSIQMGHLLSTDKVLKKQELYLKKQGFINDIRFLFLLYALRMLSHIALLGGATLRSRKEVDEYYHLFKKLLLRYNQHRFNLFLTSPYSYIQMQAIFFKPTYLLISLVTKFKIK